MVRGLIMARHIAPGGRARHWLNCVAVAIFSSKRRTRASAWHSSVAFRWTREGDRLAA
jgi:hypothetical protein